MAPEYQQFDRAVIYALTIEAGGLLDRMKHVQKTRAAGFSIWQGELSDRSILVVVSGVGRTKAAQATEAIAVAHRPGLIISAGFAGGLDPTLKRYDLIVASSIASEDSETIDVALPTDQPFGLNVHVGRLLTVDRIVRSSHEKLALGKNFEALAVDMESHAVAQVCQQQNARFLGVRVVSDPADEELPADIHKLVSQQTFAGQAGAVIGSIFRRPSAVKDMFWLHQVAIEASDKLADYVASSSQATRLKGSFD